MGYSSDQRRAFAASRKMRVLEYIQQENPPSLRQIINREGVTERTMRQILRELQEEHGVSYLNTPAARGGCGEDLGEASFALRRALADLLFKVSLQYESREEVAVLTGINTTAQLRAMSKPFAHDWTISQIERVTRLVNTPLESIL